MPPSDSESVVPEPAAEPVEDIVTVNAEFAQPSAAETSTPAPEEVPTPVAVESAPEPASSPEPTISAAAPEPEPEPAPAPSAPPAAPAASASPHFGRYSPQEAHDLAVAAKRSRMERILNRIMVAVGKRGSIANDDVQKLTHVSDRTASKYLGILTTRGLLKRIGLPNHARYEKIE